MINNFLSSLIAFFFAGGMTANTEDNVRHSSWLKTITFLVITIIVLLFFLKTVQVKTLLTYVDYRDGYSFAKECAFIKINNSFTGEIPDICDYDSTLKDLGVGICDNHSIIKYNNDHYYEGLIPLDSSGVYIRHYINGWCNEQAKQFLKQFDTKSQGFGDKWAKYFQGVVDSFLIPYADGRDVAKYSLIYCQKRIPDFSVTKNPHSFDHRVTNNYNSDSLVNQDIYVVPLEFQKNLKRFGISDSIRNLWGNKGQAIFMVSAVDHDIEIKPYLLQNISNEIRITHKDGGLNNLNYFTAADISQCNYRLLLHSSIKIKKLTVTFNTPVEISPLPFVVNKMSTYGFEVTDSASLEYLKSSNTLMHIKFPVMENKQLVRSLILTTLLTTFASLFLYNLYYLVIRIIKNRGEDKKKVKMNKRLRIARALSSLLHIFILLVLLHYSIRIYNENPYYISGKFLGFYIGYYWFILIVIIALLLMYVGFEIIIIDFAKAKDKCENDISTDDSSSLDSDANIKNNEN